jgi:hypothetical protein
MIQKRSTEKPVGGCARITISVPKQVRDEMKKLTNVNWSAVASNAFCDEIRAQRVATRMKVR